MRSKRSNRRSTGSNWEPEEGAPEVERRDPAGEEDQRTGFERDRDRILYSDALRRLVGVTQVVSVAEGPVFHNRLTHTLKVAQVGRRLAEKLVRDNLHLAKELWVHPEVVEAAALAHDLGHPPFGHIGEVELNACMAEHGRSRVGLSGGYDGNAQSFRIVTKLERRTEGDAGLNLTRASLNALLKYPWLRAAEGEHSKKWGVYASETSCFRFAREGASSERRCAAAEIMDWADDITYAVHDVEDFYRAGLIPLSQLRDDKAEQRLLLETHAQRQYGGTDQAAAERAMERLAGQLSLPLAQPFHGGQAQRGALRFFSSMLVRRFVLATSFDTRNRSILVDPEVRADVEVLKSLMHHYVFNRPALAAQQWGQRRVVRRLFEILIEISSVDGAHRPPPAARAALPPILGDLLDEHDELDQATQARCVADTIAGLTEHQTITLYNRLSGTDPGTVLNPIVM